MNNQQRIEYYLGDFYNKKITVKINPELYEFKIDSPFFYKGPHHTDYIDNPKMTPCFWFNHPDFCINIPCIAISSDGYDNKGLPALTKARQINQKNNGILTKLNIPRHWSILDNPLPDIEWRFKRPDPIWRGNHVCGYKKKPNRFDLVEKYAKKYNIRFWSGDISKYAIGQQKYYYDHSEFFVEEITSIQEQLKYKYIIAMEGNDVSTGLKWMLNSNSVVIMPKPQIESWLMEGMLIPWEHYIPLNDKLDDLDKIIEWCRNNDEKCRQIAINGKEFISMFMNHNNEKLIFDTILQEYSRNILFKL